MQGAWTKAWMAMRTARAGVWGIYCYWVRRFLWFRLASRFRGVGEYWINGRVSLRMLSLAQTPCRQSFLLLVLADRLLYILANASERLVQ